MKQLATKIRNFSVLLALAVPLAFAAPAEAQDVLHYWSFNDGENSELNAGDNEPTSIPADIGTAVINHTLSFSSFGGNTTNIEDGFVAGSDWAIAGTDNIGEFFEVEFSTEGFENVVFSSSATRTGAGYDNNSIEVSADGGSTFTSVAANVDFNDTPNPLSYNLSGVLEDVNDNASVVLRVTFDVDAASGGGNNRFDNMKLEGTPVAGEEQVATPSISPESGSYFEDQDVTITVEGTDKTIYYTLDGSDPSNTSTEYSAPFTVEDGNGAVEVRAIAYDNTGEKDPSLIASSSLSFPLNVSNIGELWTYLEDNGLSGAPSFRITGEAVVLFNASELGSTNRNQRFLQDGTAGIKIDDSSGNLTTTLNQGDGVENLVGTVGEFNNMLQFVPVAGQSPESASSTGNTIVSETVTIAEFINNDNFRMIDGEPFSAYQGQLVTIEDLQFDASGNFDSGANFGELDVFDPTTSLSEIENADNGFLFRVEYSGLDYNGEPIPQGPVNTSVLVDQRNENVRVFARSSADFEEVPVEVAAPSFSPEPGVVTESQVEVSISTETADATIYYTLDGTDPSASSTEYTEPFTLTETTTVSAIAVLGDDESPITTGSYNFVTSVTVAEARALDEDSFVEVVGIVNSNDFGFGVADYFIQDHTAGINITDFDNGGNQAGVVVAPGDSIRIVGQTAVFNNQTNIEVAEFEIINSGNPLPEAAVVTANDLTADSEFQGVRSVIRDVKLIDEDVDSWPTDPVSTGSGVNVRFETVDRDTFIVRIARNNSYIGENGAPVPTGRVNISGTIGQFSDDTQLFPFFEGDIEALPSLVQIVHNSADPALASVDIYVNGDLEFPGVDFRSATGFVELPDNELVVVGLTPAGEPLESGVTSNLFLEGGEKYHAIASGLLEPANFASNPDDEDTEFTLRLVPEARLTAVDDESVSFKIHHGATDAPNVDITARDVTELALDVPYGATSGNINVPANLYTIDVAPAGNDIIASFEADFSGAGGNSALVLASGFLNPENNNDGASFGLLVVMADGSTMLLDSVPTSISELADAPQEFELKQNFPNPFNPSTQITYSLPNAATVNISVFNVVGQRVATLVNNEQRSAGSHTISFDAGNLASGMYIYRIQAGNFVQTRKMTLIK